MGNEVFFFLGGEGAMVEEFSFKCFSGKYSGGNKGDGSFNKV